MFQTYSYTIFLLFASLQLIYVMLFYRLERKQKEGMETKVLLSTKGIYFTLLTLVLGIPTITIITSMMTGSLFFNDVGTGFYIYGLVVGIGVFLLFNNSVIKGYNGLYFFNDYFLNVKYNAILGIKCKEQIAIDDINSVRMLKCARGVLLHLIFEDKEDYFYMQYINGSNLENYFLGRGLKPEILKIKIAEFKRLEKKM